MGRGPPPPFPPPLIKDLCRLRKVFLCRAFEDNVLKAIQFQKQQKQQQQQNSSINLYPTYNNMLQEVLMIKFKIRIGV